MKFDVMRAVDALRAGAWMALEASYWLIRHRSNTQLSNVQVRRATAIARTRDRQVHAEVMEIVGFNRTPMTGTEDGQTDASVVYRDVQ